MDADRGVNLRVGCPHHCRHGASGGETGHEHALRIDTVFGDNFAVIPAMIDGSPAPRI